MTALTQSSAPAAADGAEAARLFERYGAQLYRFCLGRLRSREEAEDALQNTFLRVHQALAKGAVPRYEAAWLYKIAHNVCLTRRESAGRRARLETPRDLDDLEAVLAAPVVEHDELAGLAEALDSLPHKLRQAILLREWQGLSYAEIADAMETTVPAVETLIYRARRELAAALERGGKPRRRAVARLLDLLGLRAGVAWLRNLLAGAGVAKVAAGAALVAIGGAGLGTAITLGGRTQLRPAPTPASAPASQQAVAVRPGALGSVPAAAAPAHGAGARSAHRPAESTASAPPPAAAGAAATGTALSASATTAPLTASVVPTVASPSLQTPATSTTLAAPTVSAPTLSAPTLSTPSAAAPTLSTPQLDTAPTQSAVQQVTTTASNLTGTVSGAVTVPFPG